MCSKISSMRLLVSIFVAIPVALGVGCIVTEAFLPPPVFPGSSAHTGAGVTSAAAAAATAAETARAIAGVEAARSSCNHRRPLSVVGRGRARRATIEALGASSPLSENEIGEKGPERRAKPRASSIISDVGDVGGGGGRGKGLARRLSPPLSAVARQLRQTAGTTLAAVLIVASSSTEQDIMTAMMGLDPSLAPAKSGTQTVMTLREESGETSAAPGPADPSRLGSIDLTGQSSGAGEIAGGPGGGFKNGRLMVDQTSDLAMMLGKKMKTPDAEPRTH